VSLYPVASRAAASFAEGGEGPDGGLLVAVRLSDLISPLRDGRRPGAGDRTALAVGGTERIRTGEATVFCKVVAVAPA
jgi:hypothetical protein